MAKKPNKNEALEAVDFIPKLKPDVVILDVRMPGKNGIDVLKQIKTDESPPIVIMFTNYPYPQYRDRCLQAGADFFFDKTLAVSINLLPSASVQYMKSPHQYTCHQSDIS
jgi:CheY-like chemotaxis protein